jgi:hypothetical protein
MNAVRDDACFAPSPPFPAILGGRHLSGPLGLSPSVPARHTDKNNAN